MTRPDRRPGGGTRRDTTVAADARLTKPVTVTVDDPAARSRIAAIGFDLRTPSGKSFRETLLSGTFDGTYAAALASPGPDDTMLSHIQSQWSVPGPDGTFRNTPVTYGLVNTLAGRYFTGFTRAAKQRALAKVTARHNLQVTGRPAEKVLQGYGTGMREAVGSVLRYDLPVTATHYLEPGVRWRTLFREVAGSRGRTALEQPSRTYAAGQRYAERWNAAVFGPALPGSGSCDPHRRLPAIRRTAVLRPGRSRRTQRDRPGTHDPVPGRDPDRHVECRRFRRCRRPAGTSGYRLVTTAERGTVSGSRRRSTRHGRSTRRTEVAIPSPCRCGSSGSIPTWTAGTSAGRPR